MTNSSLARLRSKRANPSPGPITKAMGRVIAEGNRCGGDVSDVRVERWTWKRMLARGLIRQVGKRVMLAPEVAAGPV